MKKRISRCRGFIRKEEVPWPLSSRFSPEKRRTPGRQEKSKGSKQSPVIKKDLPRISENGINPRKKEKGSLLNLPRSLPQKS